MKFALRDDDLNYFFEPEVIEKNYKDIWNICPVSMSVVPFIKGNWQKNVKEFEDIGPGIMDSVTLERLIADDKIYPIDHNRKLVDFVTEKIADNKIYLTMHGIHHRNEDPVIPQFKTNYGFLAEFFTTRDLSLPLREAIQYIEDVFGQPIETFAFPQEIYSLKGLNAVRSNNLAICTSLPRIRSFGTIKLFGLYEYSKYFIFSLLNRDEKYPYPICNNRIKIVDRHPLGPGTDLDKLFAELDNQCYKNGVFVLTTHSYGFNFKMKRYSYTLGEAVRKFMEYAAKKKNVQFVRLNQVFE